ncbi:unnamed protein product (macronuclear) [Paramecium tetraurelia]|uniref:Ubiquitin-like domain-containing protein n=1 Tax=Paramecium tetraurelia TaxID=5888 RepID=A0EHG2_PARTE|nr:uncharacterized protein GSPATT00027077001 [Paramecium tetraurelia]CAK94753.1 unnamed protein product [Paramecium tetraurelia]|eukprot:XP_001462126.1 hypothetical protein (macronuclear) [Paramecium tetraurelia strain d4-2]
MSIIAKNYQEIVEESSCLQKKTIRKPKRRNQYTVDFKFGSNVSTDKLRSYVEAYFKIPASVAEKQVIRLFSNIQFPNDFNQQAKLGNLSVDPHSYNYKVIRIDKKNKLTIFTLETIDNPFTPFEQFFQKIQTCNPRLALSFQAFNQRNLDVNTYKQTKEQFIEDFEAQLDQPFTCYLYKLKNGVCSTIQRVINDKFMDLLGISYMMLEDHVLSTNILPFSTYIDPYDDVCEILSGLFEGNLKQDIRTREVMNYNGQIFHARVQNKSFFTYNEEEDAYYEYAYYIYDCDPRWLTTQRVMRNQEEYFNEKWFQQDKLRTRLVSEDSQTIFSNRNCGFKQLDF